MKVVLSYGLGVDSTAALVRWLTDPASRDFDLDDLVVLTAQTGDEWPETKHLVETYLYPLLAEHRVRTVQIARAGASLRDGYVVLDDTRTPTICHTEGRHTLATELLRVGTVPQAGGKRKCSLKFKGDPLDRWIADYTQGEMYVHVVGYEAGETGRMLKDVQVYKRSLAGRMPSYPLITWGWDRETCEQYLLAQLGVRWQKSACTYCPFALTSEEARARTLPRYVADPAQAMLPLLMEHVAVALNPNQGLIAGKRLYNALAATPDGWPVLARFHDHLNQVPWAVYEMRRAHRAKDGDAMARGTSYRALRTLQMGHRDDMHRLLHRLATLVDVPVRREGGHDRVWLEERNLYYPCREHALIAAPATAADKAHRSFEIEWEMAALGPSQLAITT